MKFSESWLREFSNPDIDSQALCEQLTMLGLEVDGVEPAAPLFSGVQVGAVLSVQPHPNADKLRCCKVASSEGELDIVCGAPNVAAGQKVALAMVGGTLPSGMQLRKAKLRGEPSHGMLCSPSELGLDELAAGEPGIWVLPADAPVGTDLREYLQLDDPVIEVAITPNRGDCFSIRGLARELAAINGATFVDAWPEAANSTEPATLAATIADPQACSAYLGREVRGLDATAITPLWMRERLRRGGIRALHPAVDVTNYVLLELGQPMHAFDLDKLGGDIQVRWAQASEQLTALNGEQLQLGSKDLLITDSNGPVALAGVIGGEATAVQEGSVNVFLESACFAPLALAGTARRHHLHTDSSLRFERGVDPTLQRHALERATALLQSIAGGVAGPVVSAAVPAAQPAQQVTLRLQRINTLLGTQLAAEDIAPPLQRLGLQLQCQPGDVVSWLVDIPAHRFDLNSEVDLVEEVARMVGYDNLNQVTPHASLPPATLAENMLSPTRLARQLVGAGFHEAITYSFIETSLSDAFATRGATISLDNPIAAPLATLRSSLLPGLLQALRYNLQRQAENVRLFEIGPAFHLAKDNETKQVECISSVMYGDSLPQQWAASAQVLDYYDIRNVVEQLLALGGEPQAYSVHAGGPEWLHPGQKAVVMRQGQVVGLLGRLHPAMLKALALKSAPLVFELELAAVCQTSVPQQLAVPAFPGTRRDLALVLPQCTEYLQIQQAIQQLDIAILSSVQVFDIYAGEGLPFDCKSVALALNFQGETHTLTDAEVAEATQAVCAQLEQQLGAKLRD